MPLNNEKYLLASEYVKISWFIKGKRCQDDVLGLYTS